jgi:Asp-tRNA(Asn)/Glu-tRNA(Gln) amidotransferase C subunit
MAKTNSLWHEVTEQEKQQIKQESKALLDKFAEKLSQIKTHASHTENNSGSRQEGTGWKTDKEFRETTFANAPLTQKSFIVAEKGAWKK